MQSARKHHQYSLRDLRYKINLITVEIIYNDIQDKSKLIIITNFYYNQNDKIKFRNLIIYLFYMNINLY